MMEIVNPEQDSQIRKFLYNQGLDLQQDRIEHHQRM
jgi:hypothetical protein